MLNNNNPLTAFEFALAQYLADGPDELHRVDNTADAEPAHGYITQAQLDRAVDDHLVLYNFRGNMEAGPLTECLMLTESGLARLQRERAHRVADHLSKQEVALLCLAAAAGARRVLGEIFNPSADASRVLTVKFVGLGVVDSRTYTVTEFGRMVLASIAD